MLAHNHSDEAVLPGLSDDTVDSQLVLQGFCDDKTLSKSKNKNKNTKKFMNLTTKKTQHVTEIKQRNHVMGQQPIKRIYVKKCMKTSQ